LGDKVGAVRSLRDLRHQATVQGYRIGWWAVRRMPARITRRAFDLAADQSWRANGAGVRRLTDNLARVCPEAGAEQLRELTRAGMRSYLRYWQEAFRLPAYDRDELLRSVHVVHGERLIAAIGSGRGMVAALPHMGNWDLAGAWMTASQDCELVSVAEQLEPVEVYEEFLAYRRGIRIEVLPAGSAETYRALESAVRRGAIVALVADRDLSRRGVPVDFFGARTRMPAGPALLAARTGAPLYPIISSYDGPTTMRLVVGDRGRLGPSCRRRHRHPGRR